MEFSSRLRGTEVVECIFERTIRWKGQEGSRNMDVVECKHHATGSLSATATVMAKCTLRRPDGIGVNDTWIGQTIGNRGRNGIAQRL